MRFLALFIIKLYQKYISPYKGFSCAYRLHTSRSSCSKLGYRAIRRYGLISGVNLLNQRTYLCSVAYRRFSHFSAKSLTKQRGDCDPGGDLPCDGDCGFPEAKNIFEYCDISDCCDCDWRKRKKRNHEDNIYLPPKNKLL